MKVVRGDTIFLDANVVKYKYSDFMQKLDLLLWDKHYFACSLTIDDMEHFWLSNWDKNDPRFFWNKNVTGEFGAGRIFAKVKVQGYVLPDIPGESGILFVKLNLDRYEKQ